MAMTLGADTYITLADATQYIADEGLASFDDDDDSEFWLKKATRMLDRRWGNKFLGIKATPGQPLYWPRLVGELYSPHYQGEWYGVAVDSDGNARNFNGIPVEMGWAAVELGLLMKAGTVDPKAQPEAALESGTYSGEKGLYLTETYKSGVGYQIDEFYAITQRLRPLLQIKSSIKIVRGA